MNFHPFNAIRLVWVKTGDDVEPHRVSQPLKLEERTVTTLRTKTSLLDLKFMGS